MYIVHWLERRRIRTTHVRTIEHYKIVHSGRLGDRIAKQPQQLLIPEHRCRALRRELRRISSTAGRTGGDVELLLVDIPSVLGGLDTDCIVGVIRTTGIYLNKPVLTGCLDLVTPVILVRQVTQAHVILLMSTRLLRRVNK